MRTSLKSAVPTVQIYQALAFLTQLAKTHHWKLLKRGKLTITPQRSSPSLGWDVGQVRGPWEGQGEDGGPPAWSLELDVGPPRQALNKDFHFAANPFISNDLKNKQKKE